MSQEGGGIGAGDDNVGRKLSNERIGRWTVVTGDKIDGGESGEDFGTFRGRSKRFERVVAPGGGVRSDPDEENIAVGASLFEKANVSGMKKREMSGNEYNAAAVLPPFAALENRLGLRKDFLHARTPRNLNGLGRAAEQKTKSRATNEV